MSNSNLKPQDIKVGDVLPLRKDDGEIVQLQVTEVIPQIIGVHFKAAGVKEKLCFSPVSQHLVKVAGR